MDFRLVIFKCFCHGCPFKVLGSWGHYSTLREQILYCYRNWWWFWKAASSGPSRFGVGTRSVQRYPLVWFSVLFLEMNSLVETEICYLFLLHYKYLQRFTPRFPVCVCYNLLHLLDIPGDVVVELVHSRHWQVVVSSQVLKGYKSTSTTIGNIQSASVNQHRRVIT